MVHSSPEHFDEPLQSCGMKVGFSLLHTDLAACTSFHKCRKLPQYNNFSNILFNLWLLIERVFILSRNISLVLTIFDTLDDGALFNFVVYNLLLGRLG